MVFMQPFLWYTTYTVSYCKKEISVYTSRTSPDSLKHHVVWNCTWSDWKSWSWVIDAYLWRLLYFSLKHLGGLLQGYLWSFIICPFPCSWILGFPAHNSKKKLYFTVERGPNMWPIISISACLPFSNSYCVLIGPCLAGGVLNSCHVRMVSLSYSKLQDAALIKRPLFLKIPTSPLLPICLLIFFF